MALSKWWALVASLAFAWEGAAAAGLESVWPKLEAWDGVRAVTLSTNLENPYAEEMYRQFVNGMTERGFSVVPLSDAQKQNEGLVAELLETKTGIVLAISKASDHTLLLVESVSSYRTEGDSAQRQTARASANNAPTKPNTRTIKLAGHPQQIAALPVTADTGLNLALLYDDRLEWVAVEGDKALTRAQFPSGIKASRSLYVGSGELDGDPGHEIAVVWGQDRDIVGKGTYTRLFAQMVETRERELQSESPLMDNVYIRVVNDRVLAQKSQQNEAFSGPVLSMTTDVDRFDLNGVEPGWEGYWLYEITPMTDGSVAAWSQPGELSLFSPGETAGPSIGELGSVMHPAVAVRLSERRMVSADPAPASSVNETFEPLPRRVIVRQSELYTIERGRKSRLAGLLEPSGQDRIVRMRRSAASEGIVKEEPFVAQDQYILDFTIESHPNGEASVVMLTNKKSDGSGPASLVVQEIP